ncbi:Ribosomal RNA large subunit methyltransferase N [Candidatus Blochmanniella vafra str. BVAF]|uniref:Dual-specificity RNA methyltransferase RlmN n=2 Tax=Candidatus Blochmanniella vafra TaxID=251535 RepID=E8Q6E7_BLOVB|nr:Ribosomal RNA large subunit methyltransferase N [Candidatus Blochmannia vafer str. BVAF]
MMLKKINLLDMSPKKLLVFFNKLGECAFRSDQIMDWIYKKYCSDFNKMTNLHKDLRVKLNQISEINAPIITHEQESSDGTRKWMMRIHDDKYVETVYIPDNNRATLCISSQSGCALGCSFCGTAKLGFIKNLRTSEIVGQVWRIARFISHYNKQQVKNCNNLIPITHIVFMGMGEPLLNLMNVVSSIQIILNSSGFNLSKHHVTLSTSGVVPGIDKLKDMVDVSLAVSLHAPNDVIRNKIMPINKKYNIDCLLQSIRCYLQKTKSNNKKVTIEYVLLNRINDEIEHAHELAKKLITLPCKVNLMRWNSIKNIKYLKSTSDARLNNFYKVLKNYGIVTTIRKVRGADIHASCGQLMGEIN